MIAILFSDRLDLDHSQQQQVPEAEGGGALITSIHQLSLEQICRLMYLYDRESDLSNIHNRD